jgi:SAM-dependent MidA family methyltransferase
VDRTSTQIEEMSQVIRHHLRQTSHSSLTFANIMELALYHRPYGYYNKPTPKLGKMGDFFTNVHVSDLFGCVLADYFLRSWQEYKPPFPLQLVEVGGGDGRLMEQIAYQFQQNAVPKAKVMMFALERSAYHRARQQKRMRDIPYDVQWINHWKKIPKAPFTIVYQHELIDAFPVHRLIWTKGQWWEVYVTEQNGKLVEVHGPLSSEGLVKYTLSITDELAEGQQIEVNLQAKSWIQQVADSLQSGIIWTLDYGGLSRELHSIRYLDGTMRYYQEHQHVFDPYPRLGTIDMTAHVNFEDLRKWGEEAGLSTRFYGTQAKFLQDAGIFSYTNPRYRNAIKQLMLGMGEHFHVLIQQK